MILGKNHEDFNEKILSTFTATALHMKLTSDVIKILVARVEALELSILKLDSKD